MPWFVPVVLRILVGNVLFPFQAKRIVGLHSRKQRLFLQFLFCAVFALVFAAVRHELVLNQLTLTVLALGFCNGFAAYCQWRAIDLSLSRTSLFTYWDDLIAIGLSFAILGEQRFLSAVGALGVGLSFVAVALFYIHANRKMEREKDVRAGFPPALFFFVGIYSVIWGVAAFSNRFFNLKQVELGSFIAMWYLGALLASIVILFLVREDNGQEKQALKRHDVLNVGVLSVIILTALALGYTSFGLAPVSIAQPIYLVAEMIVPPLIGLYVFHERKQLDATEKLLFGLAVVGGLLVGLSFS